ncbi:hypothetical protein J3E74DRAFT_295604 [Bipolaris maydis]|nr:hypothetical protein J3E74DRAFT_295604 [Bipolaris maydis]
MNSRLPLSELPKSSGVTRRSGRCLSSRQWDLGDQRGPDTNKVIVIPDSQEEINYTQHRKHSSDVYSVEDCNIIQTANSRDKRLKERSMFLGSQQENMLLQDTRFDGCTPHKEAKPQSGLFFYLKSELEGSRRVGRNREQENLTLKRKLNKKRQACFDYQKKSEELEKENDELRKEKIKDQKEITELIKELIELRKKNKKLEQVRDECKKLYLKGDRKNVELEKLYLKEHQEAQDSYLEGVCFGYRVASSEHSMMSGDS